MNDSDKKNSKVKETKVAKTTKAKAKVIDETKVEAKSVAVAETVAVEKSAPKKVAVAVEKTKPKAKKVTAKTEKGAVAKPKVETKAKSTRDKSKIDDVIIEDDVKAKATAKTKVVIEATAEPKTTKTLAKKVVTEVLADEIGFVSLPLAAKIQTQENFDLTETELDAKLLSPVFKELAEPKLPTLREENRAFLQIQSPTRVFFYWSLKQDSYNTLRRALGNRANDYFLAIRLTNLDTNQDEIHEVGNKGSWWFNNIEADSKYRAEVGFYAQGRPFVRIVFSNELETPRQKPSVNAAYQPYFAVTANQFAEVLDLAGYSQDAFEVYLAGDEPQIADDATQKAFTQLVGTGQIDFANINVNELRYVLFALASGVSLFSLRENVSGNLFEFLAGLIDENPNALTEEKVILALEEFFGVSPLDEEIIEEFGAPTVFGASLINFPKQLRKKISKLSPISSFSLK